MFFCLRFGVSWFATSSKLLGFVCSRAWGKQCLHCPPPRGCPPFINVGFGGTHELWLLVALSEIAPLPSLPSTTCQWLTWRTGGRPWSWTAWVVVHASHPETSVSRPTFGRRELAVRLSETEDLSGERRALKKAKTRTCKDASGPYSLRIPKACEDTAQ